jgi:oxygen-independent coproporphyrinogen-3 oxidase
MCWYCGCNTVVTQRDEPIEAYLAALRHEIALVGAALSSPLSVAHLHFGGGTPTIVNPRDLVELMDVLRSTFAIRDDAEIAVEIDPRTLTTGMAATLGKIGVTRASLGVQSLDPTVQQAINRVQSFDETAVAAERLRRAGVRGINVDLIYGLPHQTVASAVATVETILALQPDRFSVFGYAHVPSFKHHQRKIDAAALPNGPERHAQSEAIAARLVEAGYVRIGIDHFALPGDPMTRAQAERRLHRNFQGYTTDAADALIGLGASAIGRLPQGYVQNEVLIGAYVSDASSGQLATAKGFAFRRDDRLRGELIERLMCDFRVDLDAVCERYGEPLDRLTGVGADLDRFAAEGLIRREGGVIELEPEARSLVRAVAASFDAYLPQSTRTHSPAV